MREKFDTFDVIPASAVRARIKASPTGEGRYRATFESVEGEVIDFGLAKGLTYAEVRRAIVESRGG